MRWDFAGCDLPTITRQSGASDDDAGQSERDADTCGDQQSTDDAPTNDEEPGQCARENGDLPPVTEGKPKGNRRPGDRADNRWTGSDKK